MNAPGIGPYCPNEDCDVIDNLIGDGEPKLPATRQQIIAAAKHVNWRQISPNGEPPCFHLETERGRFCLRSQRWAGHSTEHAFTDHVFVPLDQLLSQVTL